MTRKVLVGVVLLLMWGAPSRGQDALYFTALEDGRKPILDLIAAERIRIDLAAWWFSDHQISTAIVRRFQAGVPVRFIGDVNTLRDAPTRRELEYLAAQGVPMRLRSPVGSSAIMHWKCAVFAGQDAAEFGSANWTVYSLRPYSSTNYDDETVLVTRDAQLLPALRMKFDQMWVDTTAFRDWANMTPAIRTREEPNALLPTSMVWSQGQAYNARLIAEIDAEPEFIDLVAYRIMAASVTDALVRRLRAGVRVRLVIDPVQYRNRAKPAASPNLDRLWAAGVPIRQRIHQGITHMKTMVTSTVATNGSSNITDSWQSDHNYFIDRIDRPVLYEKLRGRVAAMYANTGAFGVFRPQPPGTAALAAPGNGAIRQSLTPLLDWSNASWATSYDVLLGTTAGTMTVVASRVASHQLRLTTQLRPATRYYWAVRSRTYATPRDARISRMSATWSFVTAASSSQTAATAGRVLGSARVSPSQVAGAWSDLGGSGESGSVEELPGS
jgi:phosphatidylserine/phosphatidylglycerophosphate/cardiolipin synthase-like enzyme